MITRILTLAAGLLVAANAVAGTTCQATKGHYDALKTGVSYAQAVAIIGCEGEEMSRTEFGDIVTFMVMWEGNSFGGNMNAMFQGDEMVSKAQFGLK